MKKKYQPAKCACCNKSDLDTRDVKSLLFPKRDLIPCCPVCRSVRASPAEDISEFIATKSEDEINKAFTVYYNSKNDRYFNYRTSVIIHISTSSDRFLVTRQAAVGLIKSGGIFSTPGLTYSESVSFLLRKKETHMYMNSFEGLTTSYEDAKLFPSAKKARKHLHSVEDIDPSEWMSVRCETQFLMVSK